MAKKDFKVLLYTELADSLKLSGLGKSIRHQEQALAKNHIPYTLNPQDDYDIIHLNFYGLKSYRLAKKAKKAGKKVVYHAHSTEEDFRNSFILSNQIAPFFKKWIIKCYRLGDVIITPTPYSKRLLEGYGLTNIHAISNGLDTNFFRKDIELGKKFRKTYGFSEDDKIVVGIGLFLARKGIQDFVELAKRLPEYQFIWFGSTPRSTIPRQNRQVIDTKLPNLQFPGHVDAEMIKAALSGTNLYLFPTYEETEGIPILESLACEQQTLVRDIPVFEGWTEDGVNVWKAKNNDEFEAKIRAALEGKLPSLAKAGRKVAEDRDVEKTGKQLVAVYESLMNDTVSGVVTTSASSPSAQKGSK